MRRSNKTDNLVWKYILKTDRLSSEVFAKFLLSVLFLVKNGEIACLIIAVVSQCQYAFEDRGPLPWLLLTSSTLHLILLCGSLSYWYLISTGHQTARSALFHTNFNVVGKEGLASIALCPAQDGRAGGVVLCHQVYG